MTQDLATVASRSSATASGTSSVSLTSTGFDTILNGLANDQGLGLWVSTSDLREGLAAASNLSAMILEAIHETGVAGDGWFSAGDIRAINGYLRQYYLDEFSAAHGGEEDEELSLEERGFHLLRWDGAVGRLFGHSLESVADGLFSLGFELNGSWIENESGSYGVSLSTAADWLNQLLAVDLEAGTLANSDIKAFETGTSGTGLDLLVTVIASDARIAYELADPEVWEAAEAADTLNGILIEAIRQTNVDADGWISAEELYSVNAWIRLNAYSDMVDAYGTSDDEGANGFQIADGHWNRTRLFGEHAVDEVASDLYKLGFAIEDGRVTDGTGHKGASLETISTWLNQLLRTDFSSGALGADAVPIVAGLTGDDAPAAAAQGNGLKGQVYDRSSSFANLNDLLAFAAGDHDSTHSVRVSQIHFGQDSPDDTLDTFLGEFGSVVKGDGDTSMSTIGMIFKGFVYIEEGWHQVTVRSDDGFQLQFEGETFIEHQGARGYAPTSRGAYFEGGLYKIDLAYFENWGGQGLSLELDGEVLGPEAFYDSRKSYTDALADFGAMPARTEGDPTVERTAALVAPGSGLIGTLFQTEDGFESTDELIQRIEDGLAVSHTFDAAVVDFGGPSHNGRVEDFLAGAAALRSGDGGARMDDTGVHLTGYVYIAEGWHTVTVWSDDGFALELGGERIIDRQSPRGFDATSEARFFDGGLYKIDLYHYDNGGAEGLKLELDGQTLGAEAFYRTAADFKTVTRGGTVTPVTPDSGVPEGAGTTGTGLDQLIDIVLTDPGLERYLGNQVIEDAAAAMNTLNGMLIEAIRATGIANDGTITGADLGAISNYIQSDPARKAAYLAALGDNEDVIGSDLAGSAGAGVLVRGDAGRDKLKGTAGEDVLVGAGGKDVLRGGLGMDELRGGVGRDTLYGGADRDILDGGTDNDRLFGEGGADVILAGKGADRAFGGDANDYIRGGRGNDRLYGDEGRDWLYGDEEKDILDGGLGDDVLAGGSHGDTLKGGSGNDHLDGGEGADLVLGGEGADAIVSASDKVNDTLTGGLGADVFHFQVLANGAGRGLSLGTDTITDFSRTNGDQIQVHGANIQISNMATRSDAAGDYTLVRLQDGQGRGLGTLKVYGDAVTEADILLMDTPAFSADTVSGKASVYGAAFGGMVPGIHHTHGHQMMPDGGYLLLDGRGDQVLVGGDQNDLLVGYADYGEPTAYQVDGYRVYDYEPYPNSDDVFYGGGGADTFLFLIPIAAKPHILAEHADDETGQVNWARVAGENQNLHDHWVDSLGDNIILDYVAGVDQIAVLGHTTEILRVDHVDEDNDGMYDHSVIYVFSDQGPAHTTGTCWARSRSTVTSWTSTTSSPMRAYTTGRSCWKGQTPSASKHWRPGARNPGSLPWKAKVLCRACSGRTRSTR